MTDRGAIFIDGDLHRSIKIAAATEGCSMKALTERLLLAGQHVEILWRSLSDIAGVSGDEPWDVDVTDMASTALAAYRAALNPEGDPDA